jgi:hypothetical protein
MFRQHAVHDVLVDVDPEGPRDDPRDPWTAEARIACLEFDDRLNKCLVRPFRSGSLWARLSTRTNGGTCDESTPGETRGASKGGRATATFRMRPGLRKSDQNPHSSRSRRRRTWRPLARPAQDDQLLFEQEILRDHRSHATGATELRGHHGQGQQGQSGPRCVGRARAAGGRSVAECGPC